jgi:NADH-quinone oxidoreductase chain G
MLSLFVNNVKISVLPGTTVIQACEKVGFRVPRFCYHNELIIAGNCRMCLVEVLGSPKPVASCAMPVSEGMSVFTESPLVKKARESVLEFLLINHPLDCPICDQGGECDLQDQAREFGSMHSRFFYSNKRKVSDKDLGPLVKTVMTRCIHCTRCIRFSSEIAGVANIGTTGRGNLTEIGTFVQKMFSSELSGNLVDLCPVGALTSKPYAFSARPWEVSSVYTTDLFDVMGTSIQVESRGLNILRVIPSSLDNLKSDWFIHDRSRFAFDGFRLQRLTKPIVRGNFLGKENVKFFEVSWSFALRIFIQKLLYSLKNSYKISCFSGSLIDFETGQRFKLFCSQFIRTRPISISSRSFSSIQLTSSYIFNTSLDKLDHADLVLIVGTNLKKELPLLEARLRKNWLKGKVKVFSIGGDYKATFPLVSLGVSLKTISDICQGSHFFNSVLLKSSHPIIIVQQSLTRRSDWYFISSCIETLKDNFFIFNDKELNFSFINHSSLLSELGYDPFFTKKMISHFCFFINFDNDFGYLNDILSNSKGEDCFIHRITRSSNFSVYQGHHGSELVSCCDLVLPTFTKIEHNSFFLDFIGNFYFSPKIFQKQSLAKNNIDILDTVTSLLKSNVLVLALNRSSFVSLNMIKNLIYN